MKINNELMQTVIIVGFLFIVFYFLLRWSLSVPKPLDSKENDLYERPE